MQRIFPLPGSDQSRNAYDVEGMQRPQCNVTTFPSNARPSTETFRQAHASLRTTRQPTLPRLELDTCCSPIARPKARCRSRTRSPPRTSIAQISWTVQELRPGQAERRPQVPRVMFRPSGTPPGLRNTSQASAGTDGAARTLQLLATLP